MAAVMNVDERVYELREAGWTWKATALEVGFPWDGPNMDGGRAKRAYNRHAKALAAAEPPVLTPADMVVKLREEDSLTWDQVASEMGEDWSPSKVRRLYQKVTA